MIDLLKTLFVILFNPVFIHATFMLILRCFGKIEPQIEFIPPWGWIVYILLSIIWIPIFEWLRDDVIRFKL